jgi:hypothetical protein
MENSQVALERLRRLRQDDAGDAGSLDRERRGMLKNLPLFCDFGP